MRCPGFARLADTLSEYVRSAFSESSMQKWERYTRGLSQPVSLTYRVVFNDDLHIAKAALVRVDDAPYTTQSKLTRIMHWQYPGSMDMPTQSLFAKRAGIQDEKPGPIELYSLHAKDENRLLLADERTEIRRDIFSVLREALGQLERAQTEQALVQLRAFARQTTQEFQNLTAELHFLLGCMGVIQDLRDGLYPICFAEPCPPQQRTLQAQEAFHPLLAYREQATRNPVDFAAWGELLLLSGVNTGGKTTYLQTVGCLQLFLQLGLPVPAQSARLSGADAIALAFSMDETEAAGRGKLGLELAQLKEAIFHTGAPTAWCCSTSR